VTFRSPSSLDGKEEGRRSEGEKEVESFQKKAQRKACLAKNGEEKRDRGLRVELPSQHSSLKRDERSGGPVIPGKRKPFCFRAFRGNKTFSNILTFSLVERKKTEEKGGRGTG